MNLQEICATTSAKDVERFMTLARESLPTRDVLLLSLMLEEEQSPWRAARQVADRTGVSVHSLYVRATTLAKEIHVHFGSDVEQWAAQLEIDGYINDFPPYLLSDLRRIARRNGWEIMESTRVVLKSRRGGGE